MDGLRQKRRADAIMQRRRLGLAERGRRITVGQVKSQWHTSEIRALPVDDVGRQQVQQLDAGKPGFGQFYLLPALDGPGSSNLLG